MNIHLIRHAQTQSNVERRYTGSTDEPALSHALAQLDPRNYPLVERVYTSPMLRCRQTAAHLFPQYSAVVVEGLRECSFGEFEGKTNEELADNPAYREWINGQGVPPGGEAPYAFRARCCAAFAQLVHADLAQGMQSVAYVVHGGVVMAILERFGRPMRTFYEWMPGNGAGWSAHIDEKTWKETQTIAVIGEIGNR